MSSVAEIAEWFRLWERPGDMHRLQVMIWCSSCGGWVAKVVKRPYRLLQKTPTADGGWRIQSSPHYETRLVLHRRRGVNLALQEGSDAIQLRCKECGPRSPIAVATLMSRATEARAQKRVLHLRAS